MKWLQGKGNPERSPLIRPRYSRATSCGPSREMLERCDVFNTILMIRQDIMAQIDTPITWQGLTEPAIAFNLVKPLADRYIALENLSIVYCLMSNRLQFLHDSANLPNARLNQTRALLCELLSIRILTHYAKPVTTSSSSVQESKTLFTPNTEAASSQSTGQNARQRRLSISTNNTAIMGVRQRRMSMAEPKSSRLAKKRNDELVLTNVLIAGFHPFAGASKEVLEEEEMEGRKEKGKACNALELAIVTESKRFIACAACQKVIDSVWCGRIYYTPSVFFDIIPDRNYKRKEVQIYDHKKAHILDHYRLRVPRYRMLLELGAFIVLFTLVMAVLRQDEVDRLTPLEIVTMVYASGWALDRVATTLEHGWRVYAANLWNGIDLGIIILFVLYLPVRLYGAFIGGHEWNDEAFSILACESALMFPRLAFTLLKQNVLVMSLRAMLAQFGVLMIAAVWIFVGFWHALYTLDEGNYGVWEIAKYMTNIWFGLDATGFEIAPEFHPILGPTIFFIFACLANTLFLTVVVAILSHTFAELNQDAKAEYMFRHAVGVVEGVKSDALFSFPPPLNIPALLFLLPANWYLSPRAFHKTHVFLTRLANAPALILITIFESLRHQLHIRPNLWESFQRKLPKRMQDISIFMSGAHGDVYAVFDYAPDTVLLAKARGEDAEFENAENDEEGGNSGFARSDTKDTGISGNNNESGFERWDNGNRVMTSPEVEDGKAGQGGGRTISNPQEIRNRDDKTVGDGRTASGAGPGFPRSITLPAEGILASSSDNYIRHLQAAGRPVHLQFNEDSSSMRRASYPAPNDDSDDVIEPKGEDQQNEEHTRQKEQSPLERIYGRNLAKEDRRSSLIYPIPDYGAFAHQHSSSSEPEWVKKMFEAVQRMEERQLRIESMLKLGPSEGDG